MKLRGRCANTIIFLTILTFNRKAKTIPRIGITRSEVEILRGVDEGNLRRRFEMMMTMSLRSLRQGEEEEGENREEWNFLIFFLNTFVWIYAVMSVIGIFLFRNWTIENI